MAYATKEHVADEFVNVTFTTTTKVTDSQVDRWIAEAEEVINAYVGTRYTVPVTGAQSIIILRTISIAMVAHRVACKLQVKTPTQEPKQGGKDPDKKEFALKILKDIQSGKMDLPDAALKNSQDGIRTFNVGAGIENFFKRGVDQW